MLKKYNQHKKALILPDRSLGQKTSWGLIWSKKTFEFGIIPVSLPDLTDGDYDTSLAELSEFLQAAIKRVDRVNEFFNLTYEPGEPTHVQQVRARDTRPVVALKPEAAYEDCWIVVTEVDREFCVIENMVTGETTLMLKGKLYGLKADVVAKLVLHWSECEIITADRIRLGLDQIKQIKKEGKLSEGKVAETTGTAES